MTTTTTTWKLTDEDDDDDNDDDDDDDDYDGAVDVDEACRSHKKVKRRQTVAQGS